MTSNMKKKSTTKIFAKKSLGQNFLINKGILAKIIAAGSPKAGDTVIEVGPGKGSLTESLVASGAKVIAIEKDHRLIEELTQEYKKKDVEIIESDILEINPHKLDIKEGHYKIIANIPYYITSHFIRDIFEKWPRPQLAVLMVQREVAQRMKAKAGDMNLLALSVQFYADIELVANVSKGSFSPPPSVDSAIVKLTPKKQIVPREIKDKFFKIIKAGFSQKRKILIGNLSKEFDMNQEEMIDLMKRIDAPLKIRAEELSLEQWLSLAQLL